MADPPRPSRLPRPQIYVHVEYGVSWSADCPPRNHEVTYRSRGLRERLPSFPRQVPAPNTNYLSNAVPQYPPAPYDWDMYHGYYAPYAPPPHQYQSPPQQGDEEPRRSSRSDSRSSHERGRSAPPPFGNNPWDVDVSQPPRDTYQGPSTGQRQPPEVWKALPEVPTRFRLGEDDQPWDTWSIPYGYDPEAHPQDDEYRHPSASEPSTAVPSGSNMVSAASPTEVSTFSPGPSGPGFRPDDPGRVHELSTLGAALMTVDNGFENQWWYQGQREAVDTGSVVGETILSPQRFSRNSLGWAVASNGSGRFDGLSFATADVAVSPLPSFASPDTTAAYPTLTRSLSTRSDELFFTERSRNSLPG